LKLLKEIRFFNKVSFLRSVSKFVVGAEEDAVLPVPVFYDPISGKILESTIPVELREEYKNDVI
jgi:hypothetical protein